MKKTQETTKRFTGGIGDSHDTYAKYKKSKIEWLGKIPKHWKALKLKRLFNVQLGKMLQNEKQNKNETKEPYLRAANISWEKPMLEDIKKMWFSPDEKQKYKLQEGDLLISEGGDAGRATLWNGELENCFYQNSINRIRAKGDDLTEFLFYWIYTLKKNGYIDSICNKATFTHFTAEKVERTPFISPTRSEQKAIVKFLDRETSKIDRLIEKKEKLIDLLEEKRFALISNTVAKGLKENVEKRETKIEWLEKIPKHWETSKVKHFFKKIGSGTTPSRSKDEFFDGEMGWINSGDLNNGYVKSSENTITKKALKEYSSLQKYPPGTLIVAMYGATKGKVGILDFPSTINQACCALLQPRHAVNTKFVFYSLIGLKNALVSTSYGGGQDNISQSKVKNFLIASPPFKEQEKIVNYLNKEIAQIDRLINKTKNSIDKLKEYRTALISAAVTGKIDVRGEVE